MKKRTHRRGKRKRSVWREIWDYLMVVSLFGGLLGSFLLGLRIGEGRASITYGKELTDLRFTLDSIYRQKQHDYRWNQGGVQRLLERAESNYRADSSTFRKIDSVYGGWRESLGGGAGDKIIQIESLQAESQKETLFSVVRRNKENK